MRCTNMRTLDGKRPVFIDDINAVFFFPYLHVRFVEIPPRSLVGTELEARSSRPCAVAAPRRRERRADEATSRSTRTSSGASARSERRALRARPRAAPSATQPS